MKETQARLRGPFPERSLSFAPKQTSVTIGMDAGLYGWLGGVVGRNFFTFCVEEAITPCIRVMKGEPSAPTLLGVMASNNGTSIMEAMHGETPIPARKEGGIFMHAAAMAASFECSR